MKKIAFAVCALVAIGGTVEAQRARTSRAAGILATTAEDPADSLFRIGRQAVNENEYRRAANLFKQLVDKYPKSTKAADALFWRAWSLHRLGVDSRSKADLDDALAAIELQRKSYASPALEADGRQLVSQIRSAQASMGDATAAGVIANESKQLTQSRGCSGSKADEEMRLAALDGLHSMNAADAVPILKEVLKQRDPCRADLRKRAVFIMSQKRSADAAQTLLDVAKNDPSGEVRGEAVTWLANTGSELAVPLLDSILFNGKDEDVRRQAPFALSQVGQRNERARQSLRRAAEDEKLPDDLRGDAIFWLGNAKLADLEYFKSLFRKTQSREMRDKIMFAANQTGSAEAAAWLLELARDKTVDVETRKNAVFNASQRQSIDLNTLVAIYDQSKGNDEMQDHMLFIFSQRREPAALDKLMSIAKDDPSTERRKQAIFWIGQKPDARAKAFILKLLVP